MSAWRCRLLGYDQVNNKINIEFRLEASRAWIENKFMLSTSWIELEFNTRELEQTTCCPMMEARCLEIRLG